VRESRGREACVSTREGDGAGGGGVSGVWV